jgi:RsiW-degrading membrane proteinase PrsW (M82 family)
MVCDHCGREVVEGVFCTNCGAHQGTPELGHPQRRAHRYAAHPGEHVLHPGIFTTIFPHLGHRKVHEFRWAFLGGLAGIFVLFFAGLITAALCVAVVLLPLLYLLYLYEAQVYREEPLRTLLVLFAGSIGIGIAVTIGTNHLVPKEGQFAIAVTGGTLVIIGLVVPLIQEAAKVIPPVIMRRRPVFRDETMDGLVFGIAAGLGFGVGESFVRLSNVLIDLPVRTTPGDWIYPLVTTALLLPLLQATCTGLVCAAIWRFALARRVTMLPLIGLAVALVGHIAFSLVTQVFVNHGWSQLVVLAWQAALDIVLLVTMRVVLHFAVLEEAAKLGESEKYCSHCHTTVLAEGFCPLCGMALTATPYQLRPETTAPAT